MHTHEQSELKKMFLFKHTLESFTATKLKKFEIIFLHKFIFWQKCVLAAFSE